MNVYTLTAYGRYGGGMAVVAAHNEDEAKQIGGTIEDMMWGTNYSKPERVALLPCACHGRPRVLDHYETGE